MNTLTVDSDVCEAFARCVATAPAMFDLDDDEILHIRQPHPTGAELDRARVAVRLCPKQALTLAES